MKSGFALIEVLIATMIAGIVSIILLNALSIISRGQLRAEQQADLYMRVSVLQHQLEWDLMGAFIPAAKEESPGAAAGKKEEGNPSKPDEDDKKKKPQKEIEKVFFATAADDNLELLTFITNNPSKIYWGEKSGRAKPRIARVVYRLVPQKGKREHFKLMRQEADDLDYKAYEERDQKVRPYEIAAGIKECRLTYVWIEQQDGKKGAAGMRVFKREQAWDSDQELGKDAKRPKIPQQIQIELVMWEVEGTRRLPFTFTVPIFFTPSGEAKKEPAIKPDDKKEVAKEQQPQAAVPSPPGGAAAQGQAPVSAEAMIYGL